MRPVATWLAAAGPVTLAGRFAEAPPTAYLNQTSPEPGRVCKDEGRRDQDPDDRHAVA